MSSACPPSPPLCCYPSEVAKGEVVPGFPTEGQRTPEHYWISEDAKCFWGHPGKLWLVRAKEWPQLVGTAMLGPTTAGKTQMPLHTI